MPSRSPAARDEPRVDAVAAQVVERRLADGVVGQPGHEAGVVPEVGEADRDVGFAAAVGDVELAGLDEALKARRREPEHDFAEGDDGGHGELEGRRSGDGRPTRPASRGACERWR